MKPSAAMLLASFFLLSLLPAAADEACTENGACSLPGDTVSGRHAVLAPVGISSNKQITQAPRLKTLDGKTIAIVGGSFMASVTHPELRRLIKQHFPTANVLVLKEIGSAGPWPGPGVIRKQKDDFVRKLREHRVDAVISGNGGCGLCTPKEMGSCIAAEHLGLPAVMIAAPGFTQQAIRTAQVAGVPVPRVAEYPGAFSAHTRKQLLDNTRNILWPQILKALTTPITPEELQLHNVHMHAADIVFQGSLDEVNLHFSEQGWTDGLPIIPPTPAKVQEFLKYTDLQPDDTICAIPPTYRQATARLVAVNGVMAGCQPEFMPILIAFTKALANGDFRRTLSSTHAWTPYCWLNGPLARQLGLDAGQGQISHQKNARIGRFINLALLNLAGYHIKDNRMGTFGYLMPWCLLEDDAAAIRMKWRPYHMQQGFQLNENVLTAASALTWGNNLAPATSDAQKIMELIAWDAVEKQQFALGSGTPCVFRTLLITEHVAHDLAQKFTSKEKLEKALIDTARRPLAERAYANYWGNPGSALNTTSSSAQRHLQQIAHQENAQTTATPPWLAWTGQKKMDTVPLMTPGKTAIIVTGDPSRNKTMFLPGGGFASIRIDLPRNWNQLMKQAGYRPIEDYYLKSSLQPLKQPQQFRNYRDSAKKRPNN